MDLFGKQHASDLREKTWNMEEFKQYFQEESEKKGNSPMFQAVAEALGEFDRMQNQTITKENAVKNAVDMIKASEKLKSACQAYSDSRRDAKTSSGRERLAVIDSLNMFREDLNLDQARGMKVVMEHIGKTWGEVGKFDMAELDLTGKTREVMGANVSQRLKVEYKGKKGFFTEQFVLRSQKEYIKHIAADIDKTKEPDLKKVLEANQSRFETRLDNLNAASNGLNRIACSIGEHWNQMGDNESGKKRLGKEIVSEQDNLIKASQVVEAYQEGLKARGKDIGTEEKSRLMEEVIEEKLGKTDKKLKEALRQNKDFFMEVPAPDMELGDSACQQKYFKLAVIQAKAGIETGIFNSGKKEIQALDRVIEDGNMIHKYVDTIRVAAAAKNADGEGTLEIDNGTEMTSRNIASSRIAELLGIGGIIAHSEKMTIRSGDKVMTGCFMEFAKGVDLNSKSERTLRMIEQTELTSNASFNKDMTTLEVFDRLCGQVDRHSGNMFYQLSEPDQNGKRTIIGLQGIDNDIAFGKDVDRFATKTQGQLEDLTFIDKKLAEKINSLDRDTLEYALGDVLPKDKIDKMMQRVDNFKNHMKENMIQIEEDGWELNQYSKDQNVDSLDDKGKLYVNGLKSLEKSSVALYPWDNIHKNGVIGKAFKEVAKQRAANPEKVAISFEELQGKRPAVRREPRMNLGKKTEAQIQASKQKREQGRQIGS